MRIIIGIITESPVIVAFDKRHAKAKTGRFAEWKTVNNSIEIGLREIKSYQEPYLTILDTSLCLIIPVRKPVEL